MEFKGIRKETLKIISLFRSIYMCMWTDIICHEA